VPFAFAPHGSSGSRECHSVKAQTAPQEKAAQKAKREINFIKKLM
jgi:hypothetical protein